MSLTAAEEAQTRELLAQQAAILSLADSEAAIISNLGATDVSLSDLTAATVVDDADLLLIRQGVTDKSVSGSIIKGIASVPDASETVKGIVELATVAEAVAGTDASRAVTPAGLAAVAKPQGVSGARKNLKISYPGTSAAVTVTADELCLGNGSGTYITLRNISLTANSGAASGAANSLDAGSWEFSTFYNLFVIYNGTTAALLWSISATAPTLPSGYTQYARVGANKTQTATNYWMLGGTQYSTRFQYKVAAGSNVTTMPIAASGVAGDISVPTWVAVSIMPYMPTSAVIAVLVCASAQGDANGMMIAPNNAYGAFNSITNPPLAMMENVSGSNVTFQISCILESANVFWASEGGAALFVSGWEDNL